MKKFFHEWLHALRILIIPAFLFVCCDFLYRLSEMNVVKDAVLSFAFVELSLVLIASATAFVLVLIKRVLPFKFLDSLIGFTTAYCSIAIMLLYFKWWIFSFTIADERGLYVIRYYYVLGAALPLTAAGAFLLAKKPWLLNALEEPRRRFAYLVSIVSALSLLILSYGILTHNMRAEAKTAPEGSRASGRFNVLLIVIDSFSAKALSSYGYADNSTPVFDRLAKEVYFFPNARANLTVTGPSITSILTGRSPIKSHILGYYAVPADESERNLLTLFEQAGFRTESLVQSKHALTYSLGFPSPTEGEANSLENNLGNELNRWLSNLCRKMGFSLKFRFKSPRRLALKRFSDTFEPVSERLQRLSKQENPFFLYAHIYLPHHIHDYFYYGNNTNAGEVKRRRNRYCNFYPPEMQGNIDLARRAYDRGVSDLDREMGRFLESLKEDGILDKTIVIITADHGESFEKGYWGHGNDLSENSIRVPLYIMMPLHEGRVLEQPVQLCDVAPTILSLNQMDIPDWMDCIAALEESRQRQTAVTFNNLSEEPVGTKVAYPGLSSGRSIALYDSGWKYIMHPKGKPGELYDLLRDPLETRDLYDQLPAESKAFQTRLLSLLQNEIP